MPSLVFDCSHFSFEQLQMIAGIQNVNFDLLEKTFHIRIFEKNEQIRLEGEEKDILAALKVLKQLAAADPAEPFDAADVDRLCRSAQIEDTYASHELMKTPVVKTRSGKVIFPKTANQARLVEAFRNNDLIFGVGPAGTGKTYLAVAYAVDCLKKDQISKIILTRPAVEAGESLGFLPGDMKEKVDPYLRPLYDALFETLGAETVEKLMEKDVIEIAPLAFMRGRTLNDAVVILDEAQNTTRSQMKMFLTRMGKKCKMIVNGDATQIDLIKKKDSGLVEACQILDDIEGIAIMELDGRDIVRNPLVSRIIDRYDRFSSTDRN
jgi:phosphate starvation-inducible PhoH-like protein